MTTSPRRLTLLAVCLASVSLMAVQPALADGKVVEERAKVEAPPEKLPDLTQTVQKILKFLKEMQDSRTESMTSLKRG